MGAVYVKLHRELSELLTRSDTVRVSLTYQNANIYLLPLETGRVECQKFGRTPFLLGEIESALIRRDLNNASDSGTNDFVCEWELDPLIKDQC